MMRGFRGATTVKENDEAEILEETEKLVKMMVEKNDIKPEQISHVFFSVTEDLNATFPAKVSRRIPGWKYVPVMCMREIDVPGSLEKCIRVMLVAETELKQDEVEHVFLNDAVKLRPDLMNGKKG
ncbi:MAG: chorismate mutase [Bacilli bacterium]|nr:chorismate mutase [Bacilli bacterium]